MKKRIFVVAAVIISSYTYAQDSTVKTLDEVIISANKTLQKQSTTGKVVTVIDQSVLQRNAGKTISEIINFQSGIFVNGANSVMGANQDFYFRGAGTGNVLVLIDGIPVGDPSQINNSFDLNSINPSSIERIEILKGAQSTLWGSDAVAGVINIITKKKSASKINPSVVLSYGSYKTFRSVVGLSGKLNRLSYNLNFNHASTSGFSAAQDTSGNKDFDKDGFRQTNLQATIGYQFTSAFSISSLISAGRYKTDIDAGAFKDDKDYISENKNSIYAIDAAFTSSRVNLHFINSLIRSGRELTDDSGSIGGFATYANGFYNGQHFVSELFGNYFFSDKISLLAGVQGNWQKTDQGYKSFSSFGPFETALGDSAKANNTAAYTSLVIKSNSGFTMDIGLRFNHHSIYGNNSTYTFNPSFSIDENTRVFASISSAFKTPSLYQLYSEYGNRTLKPEETANYEAGLQVFSNNKRNSFRIVGFKRAIKNLITFYTNPSTYTSQYINRDEQNDYGFEMESTIAIGKKGNWVSNITYVDGEGKTDQQKEKNFYRRPNFTFNSVLTIEPFIGFMLVPSFRFVGTRLKGPYDAGEPQMPSYYTIDLYGSYNFSKRIKVFLDLRNITNQTYFDIAGYNNRKFNFITGIGFNF
ncbi:MAG: TonB-dependent receptor plug domain-containing protein [Chitinophagaceae bacterium]